MSYSDDSDEQDDEVYVSPSYMTFDVFQQERNAEREKRHEALQLTGSKGRSFGIMGDSSKIPNVRAHGVEDVFESREHPKPSETIQAALSILGVTEQELRLQCMHDMMLRYIPPVAVARILHHQRYKFNTYLNLFTSYAKRAQKMRTKKEKKAIHVNHLESHGVYYDTSEVLDESDVLKNYFMDSFRVDYWNQVAMRKSALSSDEEDDEGAMEKPRVRPGVRAKQVHWLGKEYTIPALPERLQAMLVDPYHSSIVSHLHCTCQCGSCRRRECQDQPFVVHWTGNIVPLDVDSGVLLLNCTCRTALTSTCSRIALLQYIDYCRNHGMYKIPLTVEEKLTQMMHYTNHKDLSSSSPSSATQEQTTTSLLQLQPCGSTLVNCIPSIDVYTYLDHVTSDDDDDNTFSKSTNHTPNTCTNDLKGEQQEIQAYISRLQTIQTEALHNDVGSISVSLLPVIDWDARKIYRLFWTEQKPIGPSRELDSYAYHDRSMHDK